jgi:hypothetical protein
VALAGGAAQGACWAASAAGVSAGEPLTWRESAQIRGCAWATGVFAAGVGEQPGDCQLSLQGSKSFTW